ncbi:MAG TPA: hypothetical protein VLL52_02365 [Anaerolineae bacterium]|nr:hypothetical protein [Anaerolineae bacterium]
MSKKTLEYEVPLTVGMQRLLLIASGLVFIIGIPLFLLPTYSQFFAWTINPPLTATFLGAGYWASTLIEYLASKEPSWPRARVAVPAVLTFTALTFVATVLHIDKFHFGADFAWYTRIGTWVWLLVYASVPGLMSVLWWRQEKGLGEIATEALPVSAPQPLPNWYRGLLSAQGGAMILLGVLMFIWPVQVAVVWPWALSALTGRAVGAWLVGIGLTLAHSGWENDWRHIYSSCVSSAVLGILQLLALWRFADSIHPLTGEIVINWNQPAIWIYLIFFLSTGLAGAYGWYYIRQSGLK